MSKSVCGEDDAKSRNRAKFHGRWTTVPTTRITMQSRVHDKKKTALL